MNREEAIEILERIKEECWSTSKGCEGCIFNEIYGECPMNGIPSSWDI